MADKSEGSSLIGAAILLLLVQTFFAWDYNRQAGNALDLFPVLRDGAVEATMARVIQAKQTLMDFLAPRDDAETSQTCEFVPPFKYTPADWDERIVSYSNDFMTLYLDKVDASEAYFALDAEKLMSAASDRKRIEFAVSANEDKGDFARFQAIPFYGPATNFVFVFQLSEQGELMLLRDDMNYRNDDPDYENIYLQHKMPGLEMIMDKVAETKTGAGCETTATMIYDAKPWIRSGLRSLRGRPPFGMSIHDPKAFPENLDFTVDHMNSVGNAELVIRYSIYKLADKDDMMEPRAADERVGYFYDEAVFIGNEVPSSGQGSNREDLLMNPTRRFINRHRLPVRYAPPNDNNRPYTIKYYVDPSVPRSLWAATKKGIEMFKPAFQQLEGYPQTPDIVGITPDDPEWPADYDPSSIRYHTVSWTTGGSSTFAIGTVVNDPRTGEILKSNAIFTNGWLESWLGRGLITGAGEASATLRRELSDRGIGNSMDVFNRSGSARKERPTSAAAYWQSRREEKIPDVDRTSETTPKLFHMTGASKRSDKEMMQFVLDGIADVTAHEVGHTLGLRHNFRGSNSITFENAQKKSYVEEHALSASIMDYVAMNIISQKTRRELREKWGPDSMDDPDEAYLFSPVIGAYDKWAIKYGYTGISTPEHMKAILNEYDDGVFTFFTDGNADWFEKPDPYTRRFDFCATPIEWEQEQLNLVAEIWENMQTRNLYENSPWTQLAGPANYAIGTTFRAASNVIPFLGGAKLVRNIGFENRDDGWDNNVRPGWEPTTFTDKSTALEMILNVLTNSTYGIPDWYKKEAVRSNPQMMFQYLDITWMGEWEEVWDLRRIQLLFDMFSPWTTLDIQESLKLAQDFDPDKTVGKWFLPTITQAFFGMVPGGNTSIPRRVLQEDHSYLHLLQEFYLIALSDFVNPAFLVVAGLENTGAVIGETWRIRGALMGVFMEIAMDETATEYEKAWINQLMSYFPPSM